MFVCARFWIRKWASLNGAHRQKAEEKSTHLLPNSNTKHKPIHTDKAPLEKALQNTDE